MIPIKASGIFSLLDNTPKYSFAKLSPSLPHSSYASFSFCDSILHFPLPSCVSTQPPTQTMDHC